MRKFRLLSAILAALMLLTLAGCGNTNNSNDTDETESVRTESTGATESTVESDASSSQQPETTPKSSVATGETGFEVGKVMPDFSVPMVGGGTFKLSEHLGKPVFINLYATWCPPCVGEMPEINKLNSELGDDVTFIVIDLGEDEATAQNFANTNSYTLPFAYSLDGMPFGSDYIVDFIPQTFVLSADGTIVQYFGQRSDYDSFKAAIDEALAQ